MIKIVRTLRDHKILLKNSLYSYQMKEVIRHSHKNIINLDDEKSPRLE